MIGLVAALLAACATAKQSSQCQPRAINPYMPIFHLLGNFSKGAGHPEEDNQAANPPHHDK